MDIPDPTRTGDVMGMRAGDTHALPGARRQGMPRARAVRRAIQFCVVAARHLPSGEG